MSQTHAHKAETSLTLDSRLSSLALVAPWLDALASEHAFPADLRFAIDLCLEEALSNVIRHGYRDQPNHAIALSFTSDGKSSLSFVIEDNAPHFTPAEQEAPQPIHASIDTLQPGGQGIRLMRKFAGALAWQQLPNGNRLTITFPAATPILD